jgi:integrase
MLRITKHFFPLACSGVRASPLQSGAPVRADVGAHDMGREINRLSARRAATLTKPGRHADGGGLYLSISDNGGRRWVFLFRWRGRLREMGLGSARTVTLARARELAAGCRQSVAGGIDPISARRRPAESMTFDECTTRFIAAHKSGWRNVKHGDQWSNSLSSYAKPVIGAVPIADVDTAHVTKILEPIWATKTETASRVRGRIEAILDWAKARGYRHGENPARWRGHLDKLLPKRSKVRRVVHHAALPYAEIGAFMRDLRTREGTAKLALEFTILTAARTTEVTGATWAEIDLAEKTWTVPAERMKAGIEHRVPLSPRALAIIETMLPNRAAHEAGGYLFPGGKRGKALSNNAMLALLDRMNRGELTTHGFRSTFRDWASERTNFPNEVVEMALAHRIKDKTEAAYRRGDLMLKRRALMTAWTNFCEIPDRGAVVPLVQRTSSSHG